MAAVSDPDLTIAQVLQRDGRASYAELARATGLSGNAVAARLTRMLESGELRIVTLTGPAPGEHSLLAHVSVAAAGPVLPLGLTLADRAAVAFASLTVGRFPIVAELRCDDAAHLRAELDLIRGTRSVLRIDVVLADVIVRDAYRSGPARPLALDDTDRHLVALLSADGRAGYAELAAACGLSSSATRARVLRLRRSGAVHVTALLPHSRMQTMARLGVGVSVSGGDAHAVAAALTPIDQVVFAMTATGRFDVVAGIDAAGDDAALQCVDAIRRLPGVAGVETWRHMQVLRESYQRHLAG